MTQTSLKKYLNQHNIVEVEESICTRIPNSYCIYKKTIYVDLGDNLSFDFEFGKRYGIESSMGSNGSMLICSNEHMFDLLKKYFDGEMSEQDIINLID